MATNTKDKINNFLFKVFTSPWFWIVLGALVVIWIVYRSGKKEGEEDTEKKLTDQAPLPNGGSEIPMNWYPGPSATALWSAFHHKTSWISFGYGTDEDLIWNTLEPLTDDQRAAVSNEFNRLYEYESGMNLREWFEKELSGEDLQRALNLFSSIQGW